MAQIAQNGLNQPVDKLHALADRQFWQQTPLATAYQTDRDSADRELKNISSVEWEWAQRVGNYLNPPGSRDVASRGSDKSFYEQTGLTKWITDRWWKDEFDFYNDPTPRMDAPTRQAVNTLGSPRYTLYSSEGDGNYEERSDFHWKMQSPGDSGVAYAGADDARIFLAAGGFPRSAPQPGTAEYRIAVEDLKSRFAACGWQNPVDPNGVLNGITGTAAQEWQQEISTQAPQRNQILDASKDATAALVAGSKSLGELLGHSAAADRLARWQDYWAPGGAGWIGDAATVIQVHAAQGKCLDVEGGSTGNGVPVQLWPCNGTNAQDWTVIADGSQYVLANAGPFHDARNILTKCLEVAGGKTDDRTKIQAYQCNGTPAQKWQFNLRATTPLKNPASGKCLDLNTFDNGKDAWLWTCNGTVAQQFDVKPLGHHNDDQPGQADFDKAKSLTAGAQAGAKQQLANLKAQLAAAQKAAASSETAMQTAYTSADTTGAPRGRGLLVGQQKDQVTKGTLAALQAMVKAGETAEAATRASAGDSQTITQRALAQAAQVQTEFRKKAAETAELQAKAAADAAKIHRDNAKKDKETAEAKLADTVKAEAKAKAAAADAHAKRLAAEAESATAKAEKETAVARQADAAQHRQNAQTEAGKAKDAKDKAEAAESTAVEKKNGAVAARDNAKAKRDDAWDAQQKSDAARAKADAKEAYAQAHESDDQAKASRAAADEASKHADDAETAAGKARGEADAASQAAADADAAATRAEAAAKRARSDADGAQAAKLVADAAVTTATSAEADAVAASQHASAEAGAAVALADDAEEKAKTAKAEADAASKEVPKAVEAAAKAAGFAHVTAQAAEDAGNAASQVAKPANDAIQLGSPYITTDSAAGLVVLTGQASKTIAEQQKAVADAHAKNAKEEAAAAQALADQAQADTKEAYQHAANAARYAADARGYATEALGYASDAATAASKAADSLARAVEYDRQATEDAAAANTAAGAAAGYAKEARTAADQAALDATAAHAAADKATQDAKDARAAADRANTAATEAEQAAKDADKFAKEAQDAADQTAVKDNNGQLQSGATTGVGGVFFVVDRIEQIGEPDNVKKDNCNPIIHTGDCKITATIHFNEYVDLYMCTAEDAPATQSGCPSSDVVFLGPAMFPDLTETITKTLTMTEFNSGIDPIKILFGDFIECAKKVLPGNDGGSWTSCAWAASWFVGGKALSAIADALHAFNVALHTGIGVREAFAALKTLKLDAATAAELEETVNVYEEALSSCKVNSFPGSTQVLMADRKPKPIRDVHIGDLVLATDLQSGRSAPQPVTNAFRHNTQHLLDITLGGDVLTSTVGHRFYVEGRGWVPVSALSVGDRLRTPSGAMQTVTGLRDRPNAASQEVYDLTVDGLHTFYVRPQGQGSQDVLVHNCTNLSLHEGDLEAHTIADHVRPDAAQAVAKAAKDLAAGKGQGITGIWTDLDTAQATVNAAIEKWIATGKNAQRLSKWLRENPKGSGALFPAINVDVGGSALGKVYRYDNMWDEAGTTVRIVLKRSPHSPGYLVYTSFPLPKSAPAWRALQ
ncbi:Glucan endo-1,3-beta-glucosidase [Streptomyces hundungensis]|uniref:Glucan endo-1,3-beta-glucosidase n=2 Tax=Streptomyces hundungensis TaxID=1077946 RepID=A0A387HC99_9ACTN|nr:Glucan endo-1,3-beta-glucosidase [Streptomyces hundungensis]